MRIVQISCTLFFMCTLAFANSLKKESPTIPQYKIEKITVIEAVRELNKLILEAHPDKPELLVAYLPTPAGQTEKPMVISLHLINNPPITVVLVQLAQITNARFEKKDSHFILYDWTTS